MLNVVHLIGRLGKDPKLKEMGGKPFVRLRLATTHVGRGGKRFTEWHDVVTWSHAEACAKHLTTGRLISVQGRLHTRRWADENGVKHYRTEVVAGSVLFLDKPDDSSGPRDSTDPDAGGWSGNPEEIGIPKDLAFLLDPEEEEDELPF